MGEGNDVEARMTGKGKKGFETPKAKGSVACT
jgi:hypothetical protein